MDEVDNVLIDEARVPLIISGAAEESTEKYYEADRVARRLQKDTHFAIKEKERQCLLNPGRRVYIWSNDQHLQAYDRPAEL